MTSRFHASRGWPKRFWRTRYACIRAGTSPSGGLTPRSKRSAIEASGWGLLALEIGALALCGRPHARLAVLGQQGADGLLGLPEQPGWELAPVRSVDGVLGGLHRQRPVGRDLRRQFGGARPELPGRVDVVHKADSQRLGRLEAPGGV